VVSEVLMRFDPPPPNALVLDARRPATEVCRLAIEAVAAIRGLPTENVAGTAAPSP